MYYNNKATVSINRKCNINSYLLLKNGNRTILETLDTVSINDFAFDLRYCFIEFQFMP